MPTSARNAGFIRVDVGIDPYDFFMIVSMVNSNLYNIYKYTKKTLRFARSFYLLLTEQPLPFPRELRKQQHPG